MKMKCVFKNVVWINEELYTCTVIEPSITGPNVEITEFEGVHLPGKTNNDVRAVHFQNTVVKSIPRGIAKIFPNLRRFCVENSQLKEVNCEDLKGMPDLEALSLSDNNLTMLNDDLFHHTKKLRRIFFENNAISMMSSRLFKDINNLEEIDFSGNASIDSYFEKSDGENSLDELIRAIDERCTPPRTQNLKSVSKSWHETHEQLYETGKFSDFTIKVRDNEYLVHKNILGAHSSEFEKLFDVAPQSHTLKNVKNCIDQAFSDFLKYFYTGEFNSADTAMEVLALADQFKVANLKTFCEALILNDLEKLSPLDVFNLGNSHGSQVLKKAAFEEMKKIFLKLKDHLMNNVELVNNIMKAKDTLDEFLNEADQEPQFDE